MGVALGTRTLDGVQLPTAGRWEIDRSHSSVEFVVRHLMVSKVRGRFGEFSGSLRIGEVPEQSSVEVVIDAAGIDTGDSSRDEHLRSADFLDVATHPTLTFRSTAVRERGGRWLVDGELTVRGVTRPVTLDVELLGVVTSPWGKQVAGFTATADIDREDFGLTWNQALETGGVLVGRKVRIELSVEAILAD
ncbi:MAG TPA: YceI family protein [Acidimicrobiales bacterium]|nr:YceI family protein [Acidimicrobiales bacterium]